jgi:hypothetical protein
MPLQPPKGRLFYMLSTNQSPSPLRERVRGGALPQTIRHFNMPRTMIQVLIIIRPVFYFFVQHVNKQPNNTR